MKTDLVSFHILGESPAMVSLAHWVLTAAPLWDTILMIGERGTGKELLAHAFHRLGPARGGELIILDASSLQPSTAESSLFGHELGAFTGATRRHVGFIESARNGTLFIDEISTLPLGLQRRFLRFLEEGTIIRIGGTKSIRVRTRVIAASNRCLFKEVSSRRFLPDLYDRLNVLPLRVPPLREREGDALLLFEAFLGKGSAERLTPEAREFLFSYPFPGNVRELHHFCRRLAVFCPDGPIRGEDFERHLHGSHGLNSPAILG